MSEIKKKIVYVGRQGGGTLCRPRLQQAGHPGGCGSNAARHGDAGPGPQITNKRRRNNYRLEIIRTLNFIHIKVIPNEKKSLIVIKIYFKDSEIYRLNTKITAAILIFFFFLIYFKSVIN